MCTAGWPWLPPRRSSNFRPSTVMLPVWALASSMPRLNGSPPTLRQVQVAIHLVVERRPIDAVGHAIDPHVLHQHRRAVRPEGVVALPDLEVADDVRMPRVGPVQSMRLICSSICSSRIGVSGWLPPLAATTMPSKPSVWASLSSNRQMRNRAHVDRLLLAVGLQDRQRCCRSTSSAACRSGSRTRRSRRRRCGRACCGRWPTRRRRRRSGRTAAPASGSRLAAIRLHAQVAVEQVVDLGAVFQEVAVADALVADAVADDEVLRAVDGDPAVVRIDDRHAQHAAAAHRVADQVEVDRVAAEHAFLAEVGEAGIADAAWL